MGNKKSFILFFVGIVTALILIFSLRKCSRISEEKVQNDYYILTNQISKMNKMVVIEQDFSSMQRTSVKHEFLGSEISNNKIITFTKTNAQVSYDLNQMKLEVDSISKKLIIKQLPNADIRITPSVEIQSIDDSFFNRIDENQIKKVTNTAKQHAVKQVDQNRLKSEGRKQLMENLNTIFVLAKALNYEIIDETRSLDLSNL